MAKRRNLDLMTQILFFEESVSNEEIELLKERLEDIYTMVQDRKDDIIEEYKYYAYNDKNELTPDRYVNCVDFKLNTEY